MISVGVDVSKGKSMVCMLKPYGEIVEKPNEIAHTESEIYEFIQRLQQLDEEVKIVMEATGIYHLPLLAELKKAGLFVSVVNPLAMKKYASMTIRKGKTDRLDAVKIANYGLDNWFRLREYKASDEVYEELRLLGRQYSHYSKMRVTGLLELTHLLDRTMPGIKTKITSKSTTKPSKDKLCDFVERYWHYDVITERSEEEFVEDYCRWAKEKGYHANQTKAKEIYHLASDGIPTMSSRAPSTKMLLLESVRVLKEINRTLELILTQMQAIAKSLPEYETVRAMGGVGEVLASRLIAEIGDVKRFESASALVAYAGIDAPVYQSGNFTGSQRRISKRGSALLRKTGYEVMSCIKRTKPKGDAAVYEYILKKEQEGKAKKAAKIAGLNKFLRIYYARVKESYRTNE